MRLSPFGLLDRWLAPVPPASKISWMAGCDYAHRGLHGAGVPENSPTGFALAIERGMGIECDVQRSSDGQAMVFHDFELDRLTGEAGLVSARSAAQLGRIVLLGSQDPIPSLRQLLDQIAGQVPLLIELKSSHSRRYAALCLAVRRVLEGYQGPHAVMSFDPRMVRWFAIHAPMTVRGLIVTEEDDKALVGQIRRRLSLWHSRPHFIAYDIRDLPSRFAATQRLRGLPLLTWTVSSAELRERAEACADAPIAEGAGLA
jgi:glycerophosphoryl diester phosphodiesterase